MANDGLDNFYFEVIEEIDNQLLNEREQFWIAEYNSLVPNGYNILKGGAGTLGYSRPQTIEEREKRRKSNQEFFEKHPEAKIAASERTKKLWEDEEYRKKQIAQYDLENNLLNTFLSGAEAGKYIIQLGLSTASINSVGNRIRECANNKRKTAYGFVWKFL